MTEDDGEEAGDLWKAEREAGREADDDDDEWKQAGTARRQWDGRSDGVYGRPEEDT